MKRVARTDYTFEYYIWRHGERMCGREFISNVAAHSFEEAVKMVRMIRTPDHRVTGIKVIFGSTVREFTPEEFAEI